MRKIYLFIPAALTVASSYATGVPGDADSISAIATSANSVFATAVPIVIAVVGFGIFLSMVKIVKRK